jgi:hypothetical protein
MDIKGISPKLSTYKEMEKQIARLAKELGYTTLKKIKPPQWNKDVPVSIAFQHVHGDPNVKVKGAVFETKGKKWGINRQQSV